MKNNTSKVDVENKKDLNRFEKKAISGGNENMSFFHIIADGRTSIFTKIEQIFRLLFDLIFILLAGFAIIFFYLKSNNVGWIFTGLAIIRFLTKNE